MAGYGGIYRLPSKYSCWAKAATSVDSSERSGRVTEDIQCLATLNRRCRPLLACDSFSNVTPALSRERSGDHQTFYRTAGHRCFLWCYCPDITRVIRWVRIVFVELFHARCILQCLATPHHRSFPFRWVLEDWQRGPLDCFLQCLCLGSSRAFRCLRFDWFCSRDVSSNYFGLLGRLKNLFKWARMAFYVV